MHAHTLHLASTLRAPAFAHEFSEFSLFLDDPFDGLALERGSVGVPSGSGTGLAVVAEEDHHQRSLGGQRQTEMAGPGPFKRLPAGRHRVDNRQ